MGNQDRSTGSAAGTRGRRRAASVDTTETSDAPDTTTDATTADGTGDGDTTTGDGDVATSDGTDNTDDTGQQAAGPESATDEQLGAAPNSTTTQVATGEQDPNGGQQGNGSTVDPSTVTTPGRNPLDPDEQAQTGAPGGATGPVVTGNDSGGGPSAQQVSEAVARQHEGLAGEGDKIVFNVTRGPVVIDTVGHVLDAKGRRRLPSFDATTLAALRRGDLIDESAP